MFALKTNDGLYINHLEREGLIIETAAKTEASQFATEQLANAIKDALNSTYYQDEVITTVVPL